MLAGHASDCGLGATQEPAQLEHPFFQPSTPRGQGEADHRPLALRRHEEAKSLVLIDQEGDEERVRRQGPAGLGEWDGLRVQGGHARAQAKQCLIRVRVRQGVRLAGPLDLSRGLARPRLRRGELLALELDERLPRALLGEAGISERFGGAVTLPLGSLLSLPES